jgi:putative acetyltransferase
VKLRLINRQFTAETEAMGNLASPITISLKRTDSGNADFQALVRELDKDLAVRNGEEHSFFDQFNKLDAIKHAVVAYLEDEPVGCGAIKQHSERVWEVKRMFVPEDKRGSGVATVVLLELEEWARELTAEKLILETGYQNPEAIRLYQKNGYRVIPNYGQYVGVASSVCFEKDIAG